MVYGKFQKTYLRDVLRDIFEQYKNSYQNYGERVLYIGILNKNLWSRRQRHGEEEIGTRMESYHSRVVDRRLRIGKLACQN